MRRVFPFMLTYYIVAVLSILTCAAQQDPKQVNALTPELQQRFPRYRLQPGDTIDVVFEFSPEFNQTVSIQPDGYVSLRGAGDVHIADETIPEATAALCQRYASILHDPNISIIAKDFVHPHFTVDGQVGKPGRYDLRGDTTVIEAIATAGGFLPSAKHSQVILFRRASNEWFQARIINVKKMEKERDVREDLHLQPGDMLVVPKNVLSKISEFIPRSNVGMYASSF
jgi:polysaccharide export outer membrane protein